MWSVAECGLTRAARKREVLDQLVKRVDQKYLGQLVQVSPGSPQPHQNRPRATRLSLFSSPLSCLSAQIQIEPTPATAASSPPRGAPRRPARGAHRRQRAAELRGGLREALVGGSMQRSSTASSRERGAGSWRATPRGAMTRHDTTGSYSGWIRHPRRRICPARWTTTRGGRR
jgi:hypothetical protein